MKVLITGACGFVGRQLCEAFLNRGDEIIATDVHPQYAENKFEGLRYIQADLTTPEIAQSLPWDDVDILYHLSAAGVKASAREWSLCMSVNVMATSYLLNALMHRQQTGLRTPSIVYTKSYYEDSIHHMPALRKNPYIATKAAATSMLECFAESYAKNICIAKVFQVFGAGDDPNNVLTYAAMEFKSGRTATFGSGLSRRDWIYIDDFINGLLACSQYSPEKLLRYDLGSKSLCSIRDAVLKIAELCQVGSALAVFDSSRDRGDTELEESATIHPPNWEPKFKLNEGIKKMISLIKTDDL